jgi:hypothetical protein
MNRTMKNNAYFKFVLLLFRLFYKNNRYNSKIIVTQFADGRTQPEQQRAAALRQVWTRKSVRRWPEAGRATLQQTRIWKSILPSRRAGQVGPARAERSSRSGSPSFRVVGPPVGRSSRPGPIWASPSVPSPGPLVVVWRLRLGLGGMKGWWGRGLRGGGGVGVGPVGSNNNKIMVGETSAN